MPEEITPEPVVEPIVEPVVEPIVEPDPADEPDDKKFDLAYVKTLRSEAAARRTEVRDLQAKYADAKTPEQVAEITAEIVKRNTELEREALVSKVARKHKLPDNLAARLVGADEKALEADAKELAKLVVTHTDPELNGGLNPLASDDGPSDPKTLAKQLRQRRR